MGGSGGGGGSGAAGADPVALPREEDPSVPSDDGERLVEVVVLVVGVAALLLNGLAKELQEQVGHWRGSLSSAELRDFKSQCLREKTGMSKKAQ